MQLLDFGDKLIEKCIEHDQRSLLFDLKNYINDAILDKEILNLPVSTSTFRLTSLYGPEERCDRCGNDNYSCTGHCGFVVLDESYRRVMIKYHKSVITILSNNGIKRFNDCKTNIWPNMVEIVEELFKLHVTKRLSNFY